jgi:hypothetical protein
MNIGIVTYGGGKDLEAGINLLKSEFNSAVIFVFNNNVNQACSYLDGDNEYFEFSAYKKMIPIFNGAGPFLILNDTLFKTHRALYWIRLIQNHQKIFKGSNATENAVFGDIRFDGNEFNERPNPFLASWVFLLHSRKELDLFGIALSNVCNESTFNSTPEYDNFIHKWLNNKSWFSGWHGPKVESARKIKSIKMEHRLSKEFNSIGLKIKSLGEGQVLFYKWLRLMDRLYTRMKAWQLRLK